MKLCYAACACKKEAEGGGICTFSLTDGGRLIKHAFLPLDRPMYAAYEKGALYVILREAVGGESGIVKIPVYPDGTLGEADTPRSSKGKVACHLSVKDGALYAANYLSGSIIKLPDTVVTHEGHGITARQESPHPHFIAPSPDGYILVADLGLDKIFVLTRDLSPVSEASVPAGSGARHLVFSPDGSYLYCIGELSATVSLFSFAAGQLTYLGASAPAGEGTAAAIRISQDGKYLYTSVRGENTVTVYRTNGNEVPTVVQKTSCGGNFPRDILLTPDEKYLLSANQYSDDITVFSLEGGLLKAMTDRQALPSPLCITPMPLGSPENL